jgi:tight adherence protein C
MKGLHPALGLALVALGVAMVASALGRRRRVVVGLSDLVDDYDLHDPLTDFEQKLADPFVRRVARTLSRATVGWLERLLPANYLAGVQRKLQLSGTTDTTAGDFVVGQAALAGGLGLLAAVFVVLAHPPRNVAVLSLVGLPAIGALLPTARLNRKVTERSQAIRRDLPDTLDLLAISVEAGMGFEGALDVVCQYFKSPLAEEFSLTLREMELGLPRRDAFQNLKQRTDVPELSTFILALLQADALGIPIGRVLKTQSAEMRVQRRMWAREKAGKLPVKILFPMIIFIFPPVMAVVLGPALGSMKGL